MAGEVPLSPRAPTVWGRGIGVAGGIVPDAPRSAIRPAETLPLGMVGTMLDSPSGYAPSGDALIAYWSAGQGRPVVFIHAGIADSRMWRHQLDDVPPGFRYVSLDLRGHGATTLTEARFSNHEDVLAVMDYLEIDAAVVVGCSMGGGTAFDLALTSPERVSGLVVIGAGAPGFDVDD